MSSTFVVGGMSRMNNPARFAGPITADTSDDDLNYLAEGNGYALGVPVQITTHLLKQQRHICQLERRLEALEKK